MLIELIG